jgi:hypothetical protein
MLRWQGAAIMASQTGACNVRGAAANAWPGPDLPVIAVFGAGPCYAKLDIDEQPKIAGQTHGSPD